MLSFLYFEERVCEVYTTFVNTRYRQTIKT